MIKILLSLLLVLFSKMSLATPPKPDGDWNILSKTCNLLPQKTGGTERIFFRDGFWGHSYLQSENTEQICTQVEGFNRVIQSYSSNPDKYEEISTLISKILRTVCRSKANGNIISDNTVPLETPLQTIKITLHEYNGSIELENSSFCKEGILQLKIQRKTLHKIKLDGFENEISLKIEQ